MMFCPRCASDTCPGRADLERCTSALVDGGFVDADEWHPGMPTPDVSRETSATDEVENPPYLTRGGVEFSDICDAYDLERNRAFALKYVLRAGSKRKPNESSESAELRDLKKAAWYIRRRIERLESKAGNSKGQG